MKIIDIFNKMANNEIIPKRFRYDGYLWDWCETCQCHEATTEDGEKNLFQYLGNNGNLNDEIEIICLTDEKTEQVKHKVKAKLTATDFEKLGYGLGKLQKAMTKGFEKALNEKPIEEEKIKINSDGTLGFPDGSWSARNMDIALAMRINKLFDAVAELKGAKNEE